MRRKPVKFTKRRIGETPKLDQNEKAYLKWQKQKEEEFIQARSWLNKLLDAVEHKLEQPKGYVQKTDMKQGLEPADVYKNIQTIMDYINLPF